MRRRSAHARFHQASDKDEGIAVAVWVFVVVALATVSECPSVNGLSSGFRSSRGVVFEPERPCPPVSSRRRHLPTHVPYIFPNYKQTIVNTLGLAVNCFPNVNFHQYHVPVIFSCAQRTLHYTAETECPSLFNTLYRPLIKYLLVPVSFMTQ